MPPPSLPGTASILRKPPDLRARTPGPGLRPPEPPSPVRPASRTPTPTGRELQDLLQSGLEGFASLEAELAPPADPGTGEVVSIDHLVYRGPTALTRAIELRDAWRSRGSTDRKAVARSTLWSASSETCSNPSRSSSS